jgi:hypothetical protein
LGAEKKEDGIFFIAYEDYVKFFYITSICKYGEKGKRSVVDDEHGPAFFEYSLIRFSVK